MRGDEQSAFGVAEDLPAVQPLVIPSTPEDDESLIGIIASATAKNVLGHTNVILREVGLDPLFPGHAGQTIEPLLGRLAAKLGFDASLVAHRVHPYLDIAHDGIAKPNAQWPIRWGSGTLARQFLSLERRRIAPITLQTSAHHRWQWLSKLLPYCPISLERLVDTCGACEEPLGWNRARGIATCETCRRMVPPSDASPLPDHLAHNYRRFAELISPTPGEREKVLNSLHEDLRDLSPTSLIALVLRTGWLLETEIERPWKFSPGALDQPALAKALSIGMGLMANWPRTFRETLSEASHSLLGDDRAKLLLGIRKMGDRYQPADLSDLVRRAIPEAFEMTQRAMALDGPTMLSCDICQLTGIDAEDVRRLDAAGALTAIETRTGERRHVQFSKKQVEEFAASKKGSQRATRMAEALGLPRYAIEQLLGFDEVDRELNFGVLVWDDSLRLVTSSVEAFFRDLNAKARDDAVPDDAVPLWNASRCVGGGLKNWGQTLAALRHGQIPFWLVPDEQRSRDRHSKIVRRILVVIADVVPTLGAPVSSASSETIPIAEVMSQVDAAEVLNIDAVQMKRVAAAGDLTFEGKGKAMWASRAEVLDLAHKYIASPELTYRLGGFGPAVTKMIRKRPDIRGGAFGWVRADVERELGGRMIGTAPVLRKWSEPSVRISLNARARSGQRISHTV